MRDDEVERSSCLKGGEQVSENGSEELIYYTEVILHT
jgi:hypothetical protein